MNRENMKKERKSWEGEEGKVVLSNQYLRLKLFRYKPEVKKLNIICTDVIPDTDYDIFRQEDYDRQYGDIVEMYIPKTRKLELEIVSKKLARKINNDSFFDKYVSIVFIAVGAAGLCVIDMLKYLKIDKAIMIATISTPFYGTLMANRSEVNKFIRFFDRINRLDYQRMTKMFHILNKDLITGSKFLLGIDYEQLKRCRFINFVAEDENPETKVAEKVFGPISNDGIVTTISQECMSPNVDRCVHLVSSHEDALFKVLEYFRS